MGTLNFGEAWKETFGECNKETSFKILDMFFESGGNFLDTANNYQNEESEMWIGEWMAQRKNRDQMVVATKFTTLFPAEKLNIKHNYSGNHSKSLKISLEASLKKLQTDYIDLLYIHWWDWTTSIPELMQALHHVVAAGKVLYLGISDTPAWIVSKANEYARQQGLTQFSVYQGWWSAAVRDFERDIIPMCQAEGMALCPWGALGRGAFMSPEDYEKKEGGRKTGQSENILKISAALDKIAKGKGTAITSIAQAYLLHKAPYVFPIIGLRKIEHLKSNIQALRVELTDEEVDEIDGAAPFDVGFPMSFLFEYMSSQKYNSRMNGNETTASKTAGWWDAVERVKPPRPHKE